jgi:hypothetical protein
MIEDCWRLRPCEQEVKLEVGRKLEGCHIHAKEKWISTKKLGFRQKGLGFQINTLVLYKDLMDLTNIIDSTNQ